MKYTMLLTIALLMVLSACGKKKAENIDNSNSKIPVVLVQTAQATDFTLYAELTGTLQGETDVQVSVKSGGEVSAVYKKVGDWVTQGEAIAQVDDRDYRNRVKQAQAALAQARVTLDNARIPVSSTEELYRSGKIAKAEYDRTMNTLAAAQAGYDAADASLGISQKALDDTRQVAPVSGQIVELPIKKGQTVASGQALCSLVDIRRVQLKTGASQADIAYIKKGAIASVIVPGDSTVVTGSITGVANKLINGSYPVEVTLPNPQGKLLAGSVITAKVVKSQLTNQLQVPRQCLVQSYGRYYLFAVQADRAVKKQVQVLDYGMPTVIITQGLNPGEQVVVEGQTSIDDGVQIQAKTI